MKDKVGTPQPNNCLHGATVPFLGAAVGGKSGNDVADPAEQPAAADPQPRRDDQPEDAPQEVAVVKLSNPRYQRAQHRGDAGALVVGHAVTVTLPGVGLAPDLEPAENQDSRSDPRGSTGCCSAGRDGSARTRRAG